MNKITVGRTRKKSKNTVAVQKDANPGHAADAVFVFGAAAVCAMLALPMLSLPFELDLEPGQGKTSPTRNEVAVTVMSSGVETITQTQEREELVAPSNAESEEEWSFYDYIGELFAGLISGQ